MLESQGRAGGYGGGVALTRDAIVQSALGLLDDEGLGTASRVAEGGNGRIRTNFDGYSTRYQGVDFTLTKRLSNPNIKLSAKMNGMPARQKESAVPRLSTPWRNCSARGLLIRAASLRKI